MMANKNMFNTLAISEVLIKNRMRYYYLHSRMAKMKNTNNTKCWQGCEETGSLLHCHWECKVI